MNILNRDYIAIGGSPRSGTTALADLLNIDGRLFITRELRVFRCWYNSIGPKTLNYKLHPGRGPARVFSQHKLDCKQFRNTRAAGKDIAKFVLDNSKILYFGDKLPRYHLYGFEKLAKRFPNMKFIFCLRDGRAVIASQMRLYRGGRSIANFIAKSIPSAEPLWLRCCRYLREALNSKYADRILVVRYEDAVNNLDKLIYDISDFLNLPTPLNIEGHDYYPVHLDAWKEELPNMMDRLSPEFKQHLREFGYE